MRCDQCRFWVDDPAEEYWEGQGIGFKRCSAVLERWKIKDAVAPEFNEYADADTESEKWEKWIAARRNALKASRAYVEDGSEYKALLWTAPDFFCALFKQK